MITRDTDILRIIPALRLIFWGGLLCFFDFKLREINGNTGTSVDLINDTLGLIFILYGLAWLRAITVNAQYAAALRYCTMVAVLLLVKSIHDIWIYPVPDFLNFLFSVLGVAKVVALVVFSLAMCRLCVHKRLVESARSWITTRTLFIVIYLIPLGLLYTAGAFAALTGGTFDFHTDNPGLTYLFLAIFFIPFIHLFLSTSRMIREAEEHADMPEIDAEV
ncbi:MAG: hypothetical protein ACYDBB_24750 [Armatimonadota bacterium]